MNKDLRFSIKSIPFDEHYQPANSTRITTNFANLARGQQREENLRNTFRMINNRFNALAHWDNPTSDRYAVALDIISVGIHTSDEHTSALPLIELLKTSITDRSSQQQIAGIVGNNFSSYVRDYISAYCCRNTTNICPVSACRMISVSFTAGCISILSIQIFIKPISANNR